MGNYTKLKIEQIELQSSLEEILVRVQTLAYDVNYRPDLPCYYHTDFTRTIFQIQRNLEIGQDCFIGIRSCGVDSSWDFFNSRKESEYVMIVKLRRLDETTFQSKVTKCIDKEN